MKIINTIVSIFRFDIFVCSDKNKVKEYMIEKHGSSYRENEKNWEKDYELYKSWLITEDNLKPLDQITRRRDYFKKEHRRAIDGGANYYYISVLEDKYNELKAVVEILKHEKSEFYSQEAQTQYIENHGN